MARRAIETLVQLLRRSAGRAHLDALSDAGLLERFAVERDDAAFEGLLRRFGPMVFAVCRRILNDVHEAEDAFQATFLVLAQKAPSLTRRDLVGNWLYGVAFRTAKRAKADAARRQARERKAVMPTASDPREEVDWRDLRPVLDEEILALPDKYRRPFVLCYLEGRTNEEAARVLGWPVGTLFTRLARARELLRHRLSHRGLALSGLPIAALLTSEATAAVSAAVIDETLRSAMLFAAGKAAAAGVISARAAALAEGVLHAMFLGKLKATAVILVLVGTLIGAGAVGGYQALQRPPARTESDPLPVASQMEPIHAESPTKANPNEAPATQDDEPDEPDPAPPAQDKSSGGFGIGFGSGTGGGSGFGFGSGGGFGMGSGIGGSTASHKLSALTQKSVQRELKLTTEQRKKLRALETKQKRELLRLMPQNPLAAFNDPAAAMKNLRDAPEKMKRLGKEIDEAIDRLLTAEQGRRLREISLQLRGGHALNDAEVAEALKLTKEQKAKLQEIHKDAMKEMQDAALEAMNNAVKGGFNPAAFQKNSTQTAEKMQQLWKKLGDELMDVLTTEQKSEWRKLTGKPFKVGRQEKRRSR